MLAEHAGVDGEVVDALFRLMLEHLEDDLLGELLDAAADDHRVDRHGPDRHAAVRDDGFAAGVQIAAGRQIHHRVGAPAHRPAQLLDLFGRARRDRRCAEVRVDLGQAGAADGHRVEPVAEVHLVGGDDHPAGGDLVAHLLGREVLLALGDPLHLGRDGAEARVLELRDGFEALRRDGKSVLAAGPSVGKEVPRRLPARRRHPGRVGRAEAQRTAEVRRVRERTGARPFAQGRGVVRAAQRQLVARLFHGRFLHHGWIARRDEKVFRFPTPA